MKIYTAITLFILCLSFNAKAQNNLVSNGEFELYSTCPGVTNPITNANGWVIVKGTPDYNNKCSIYSSTTIPNNNYTGYQQDCFGGNGFAGIYTAQGVNDDREFTQTKLIDTLSINHKYLASIYVNRANKTKYAIAKIGMLFTDTSFTLPSSSPSFTPTPQLQNNILLTDSINWVILQDTFVAKGHELYLTIGNFNLDANSDTIKVQNTGFNGSYYYIDGVSLYDITGDSCNNLWDAGFNKYIFAGDSIRLGAINTDNSTYTWINSASGATYLNSNADAHPWATPSVTTTYYVTKTCPNNNMFIDTVTIYVQQHVGIKQVETSIEQVSVYPNPSSTIIQVSSNYQITEIKIIDLLGKEVLTSREKEIDINNLHDGVYFIEVKTNTGRSTQKIIVQH
jgi:hypothetical protein